MTDTTPWISPVTLCRNGLRLEPLGPQHAEGLAAAARDGELWKLRVTGVPDPGDEAAYIATATQMQDAGSRLPFAVIDEASGRVLGSTSYHDILPAVKRLEIGYTWYARSAQRSHVNTTAKLMLLTHAFETLDCIAVEFRTHRLNTQSRRAIERLGAQLDGILRAHQRSPDGTLRDTAVYSITAAEWPTIRTHLRWQLERPR
ncbi:MAG: hypothetical protein RL244_2058 [Pseudomonadota bacterium]